MTEYSVKLVKKHYLTSSILILEFTRPADFNFDAGQFVQFLVPNGEKPAVRAYSISSAPQEKRLEFCVKILEDGIASQWFAQMEDGAECTIRGPRGHFCASKTSAPIQYIATGTGIAPIMSMLREELIHTKTGRSMELLFGVRHERDVFWMDACAEMDAKHTLTLSQPEESWQGLRGRVTDHLPEFSKDVHYFICGSAQMVKDVRAHYMEAGADRTQLHFEIF